MRRSTLNWFSKWSTVMTLWLLWFGFSTITANAYIVVPCKCTSDRVYPQYLVTSADMDRFPAGTYFFDAYLDGKYFQTVDITVAADRSISINTPSIGDGGFAAVSVTCPVPCTRRLTCDGRLYDVNHSVVGVVNKDLGSYSFAIAPCSDP